MEKTLEIEPRDQGLLHRLQPQADFEIAGESLHVQQRLRESVGAVVWEAELVLCRYLEECSKSDPSTSDELYPDGIRVEGMRILELGAGTGLAGMACVLLGAAEVVLTDREEILDITFDNVRDNMAWALDEAGSVEDWRRGGAALDDDSDLAEPPATKPAVRGSYPGKIQIKPLLWGADAEPSLGGAFDLILAADLLYNSDSHEALVKSLVALCTPATTVLLVQKWRNATRESSFLMHAEMAGLVYDQLRWQVDLEGKGRWSWSGFPGTEQGIQIYRFRKNDDPFGF